MKHFRFRLQRLLDVREQETRALQRELAAARQAVGAAEQGLRAVERLLQRATQRALEQEGAGLSAQAFALHRQHLMALAETRREAEAGLASAREREEEQRRRVLAARTRVRVLERLRERRHEQWQVEQARAEQVELDELAVQAPDALRASGLRPGLKPEGEGNP